MPATSKAEGSTTLPVDKGGPEKDTPAKKEFSAKQLALGLVFGVIFGFLLQKGGVAKYHILLGVLLLEDFTVVKVMLTAIIVGCVGIFALLCAGPGQAARQAHAVRGKHHRRVDLRHWFWIDGLLPRNRCRRSWAGELGRDCGRCWTDAGLLPVCGSVWLARQDAPEGRGPRQAHVAGAGRSEPAGVPRDFSAAVDCSSLRYRAICGQVSKTQRASP